MDTLNKIVVYIAGIVTVIALVALFKGGASNLIGDSSIPNMFGTATNGQVSVGSATSSLVLAANGIRQFAEICNHGTSTQIIYVSLSKIANTDSGITLGYNSCFEINNTKQYTGPVSAYSETGTTTITYVEK